MYTKQVIPDSRVVAAWYDVPYLRGAFEMVVRREQVVVLQVPAEHGSWRSGVEIWRVHAGYRIFGWASREQVERRIKQLQRPALVLKPTRCFSASARARAQHKKITHTLQIYRIPPIPHLPCRRIPPEPRHIKLLLHPAHLLQPPLPFRECCRLVRRRRHIGPWDIGMRVQSLGHDRGFECARDMPSLGLRPAGTW